MRVTPWTRDEFMRKVIVRSDGCWEWAGAHTTGGYAVIETPDVTTTAHRFAYTLFVGPIADDLDADHLCMNRWCVNPYHVEAVTHRENIHRMPGLFGRRARAKLCDRGHELTVRSDGRRRCKTCHREARMRRAA